MLPPTFASNPSSYDVIVHIISIPYLLSCTYMFAIEIFLAVLHSQKSRTLLIAEILRHTVSNLCKQIV